MVQTNVSRSSVREALSALELAGVIERRPGDGTYVKTVPRPGLGESVWQRLLEEGEGALEALEARRAIEPGLVALACERITQPDLAELDQCLAGMEASAGEFDVDGFLDHDARFHGLLARYSGNYWLGEMMEALLAAMKRRLWHALKTRCFTSREHLADTLLVHRRIREALAARDAAAARGWMEEHFRLISERLEN